MPPLDLYDGFRIEVARVLNNLIVNDLGAQIGHGTASACIPGGSVQGISPGKGAVAVDEYIGMGFIILVSNGDSHIADRETIFITGGW